MMEVDDKLWVTEEMRGWAEGALPPDPPTPPRRDGGPWPLRATPAVGFPCRGRSVRVGVAGRRTARLGVGA